MAPTFMGGKLSLKGDKKSKKKKKKKSSAKHELDRASRRETVGAAPSSDDDELTEAERRSRKVKQRVLLKTASLWKPRFCDGLASSMFFVQEKQVPKKLAIGTLIPIDTVRQKS